jgi:hypothetical protein
MNYTQNQRQSRRALRRELWLGIILVVVMLLLASMQACTIGTKERVKYVHTSYNQHTKFPGIPQILTNKLIPVQLYTDNGIEIIDLDLGGYYAIPEQDLLTLLEAINAPRNKDTDPTE